MTDITGEDIRKGKINDLLDWFISEAFAKNQKIVQAYLKRRGEGRDVVNVKILIDDIEVDANDVFKMLSDQMNRMIEEAAHKLFHQNFGNLTDQMVQLNDAISNMELKLSQEDGSQHLYMRVEKENVFAFMDDMRKGRGTWQPKIINMAELCEKDVAALVFIPYAKFREEEINERLNNVRNR